MELSENHARWRVSVLAVADLVLGVLVINDVVLGNIIRIISIPTIRPLRCNVCQCNTVTWKLEYYQLQK